MSDFQRLQELLLDDERAARARADARIDALERRRFTPQELPLLVEAAGQGETAPRLARALAAPVADALGDAVVQRRQTIVDALFPVIGPAIRKAIAESMRVMVEDLNAAIESSLTPRGLRWRVEALRTGAPYAQVVLRHTLRWRIEHVFLIEPGAGLVIHHESAPGLAELDSDAIAGMLTAIGDFVQDSVGRASGATLASANVGEHVLWVEDGPRARLACFIRGAPPAALRTLLRARLEQIHERFADPLAQLQAGAADVGAALDRALDLPGLERDARAVDDAPPARAAWPAVVLAVVVGGALIAWGVHEWRWSQRVAAVSATLAEWPGLAVQDLARDGNGLRVRALLDPLADPPQPAVAALLPVGAPLVFETRGYIATDGSIVERRARAVLTPPDGVTLRYADGVMQVGGELGDAERAALLARAALVPGVVAVDGSALLAREARLREELDALRARIEAQRIAFDGDAAVPADPNAADALIADLRALLVSVKALGLKPALRTRGGADDSGPPARNADLRAARARWLAAQLAAALAVDVESEGADGAGASATADTLEARAAAVAIDLGEGQQR